MPFAGFDDWDECVMTMTEEEGHDQQSAENICGALQAEAKSEQGDVEELKAALERGAGLIADVGVDLVSGVDVPAVDSKWVMTKDAEGHDWRANSPILLSKDDSDQRISHAAAMIPRETDKEGDVVATPTVEQAAHDFLKSDGGVDTDHSLIDGEGEVVESWVLKEDRTFDLPGGETETYGAGTWMVGIEWGAEAWDRIKSGDLTGRSIYGMAEHVPLSRSVQKDFVVPFADESVVNVLYASRAVAAKAARRLGFEGDDEEITHAHQYGDVMQYMPAPGHDEYVEAYNEFAEADGFGPVEEDGRIIEASATIAKGEFSEGEAVYWDWQGTRVHGRIAEEREESATVDGVTITGEDDEPVYIIDEYDEEVDALRRENVAKPESSLNESGRDIPTRSEGNYASEQSAAKSGTGTTPKADNTQPNNMDQETTDDGPDIAEVAASVEDLAESVAEVKDAVETEKADEQDAAESLAETYEGMGPGDVLDLLEAAAGQDLGEVMTAIEQAAKAQHGDDEDDDEEMEASVEDRTAEAKTAKGADAAATAAKGIEQESSSSGTGLSYRAVAEQERGD